MHQHGHNDPNAAKLYDLIKDVKIAMMTTVDTDGTSRRSPQRTDSRASTSTASRTGRLTARASTSRNAGRFWRALL